MPRKQPTATETPVLEAPLSALEQRIADLEAQLNASVATQSTPMPGQVTSIPAPPPARYFVIYNQTRQTISFPGNEGERGYTVEPKQAERPGYLILPGEEGLKLKNNFQLERLTSGIEPKMRTEWTDKAPGRSDPRPEKFNKLPMAGQAWVEEVVYQEDWKSHALIDTQWINDEDGTEDFELYKKELVPRLQAARDFLQQTNFHYRQERIKLITARLKGIASHNL